MALRQRPPEQLEFLVSLLRRLTEQDGNERLFDYVLLRLLESYLWDLPNLGLKPLKAARTMPLATALVTLLRCVAAFGHDDGDSALAAFRASVSSFAKSGTRIPEPDFTSLETVRNLGELDDALARLATARPVARERVLRAVLECIRHDHRIELAEYELFRAIAATLGCPIPPAAAATGD